MKLKQQYLKEKIYQNFVIQEYFYQRIVNFFQIFKRQRNNKKQGYVRISTIFEKEIEEYFESLYNLNEKFFQQIVERFKPFTLLEQLEREMKETFPRLYEDFDEKINLEYEDSSGKYKEICDLFSDILFSGTISEKELEEKEEIEEKISLNPKKRKIITSTKSHQTGVKYADEVVYFSFKEGQFLSKAIENITVETTKIITGYTSNSK